MLAKKINCLEGSQDSIVQETEHRYGHIDVPFFLGSYRALITTVDLYDVSI